MRIRDSRQLLVNNSEQPRLVGDSLVVCGELVRHRTLM